MLLKYVRMPCYLCMYRCALAVGRNASGTAVHRFNTTNDLPSTGHEGNHGKR